LQIVLSREETPRLDTTKWHYSSDGLFRSANKLDGNMTILLTLAFFENLLDHDLKYAPSFDYKLNGEPHEMDFGIIASQDAETRCGNDFRRIQVGAALKAEERKKLKAFGEKTGAYLCFCTLADDFDDTIRISSRSIRGRNQNHHAAALLLGNGLFRVVAFPR